MDISDIFSKVRGNSSSGLENQRQVAVLLAAIEQTIQEQNEPLVPWAYFGALMTIVEQQQSVSQNSDTSNDSVALLSASVYLLAMVFPRISTNTLRLKFTQIADALVGLLESRSDQAPLLRSTISCLEYLLLAQDGPTWSSNDTCKQIFETLLFFTIDDRPKVRRIAVDVIHNIIKSVPPPSLFHPATSRAVDFCIRLIAEFLTATVGSSSKSSGSGDRSEAEEKVLCALAFLKSSIWIFAMQAKTEKTRQMLDKLCVALLAIPARSSSVGNTILTQCVFQVFDALLGGKEPTGDSNEDTSSVLELTLLSTVVKRLLELSPYENDSTLTPAWLGIIADGFQCLSVAVCAHERDASNDSDEDAVEFCELEYPELVASLFDRIFKSMLEGATVKPAILQRATILLSVLSSQAVSNSMVTKAIQGVKDCDLLAMLSTLNGSLSNIHSRDAWGYILLVATSMIERVGRASPTLIAPTLSALFAFRDDRAYADSFPYKEELSRAINAAIQALGITTFSEMIPLNIENEFPDQPRRPYLLSSFHEALQSPVIVSQWEPTRIMGTHTIECCLVQLLPLATRMLEKAGSSWVENRQLEAKLHETLGIQIFQILPLICGLLPPDVESHFGKLAPHLGRLLQATPEQAYPNLPSQYDVRPILCECLQNLIGTYLELSNIATEADGDKAALAWHTDIADKAKAALKKISIYVNRFLSTLCNNYTTINPELIKVSKAKGQALQVLHEREIQHYEKTIRSFLLIADKNTVSEYFISMIKLLLEKQTALQMTPASSSHEGGVEAERLRMYAILDLMQLLIPFLPNELAQQSEADSPLHVLFKVLVGQLKDNDTTIQKKTYNALDLTLKHIAATSIDQRQLFECLFDEAVVSKVTSGTRRSRTRLIQHLCETLTDPTFLLEVIPEALPEVILTTKEASERSRDAAYLCLVSFGREMMKHADAVEAESSTSLHTLGSSLRQGLGLDVGQGGNDGDDTAMDMGQGPATHSSKVSLREYFLMVVAGLAATTSHMQSASIASLGRLLFEFSDLLDTELIGDLIKTVLMSMQSKNKEVIKAALGFIKVAIVCLPQELLEEDLETISVSILEHSREHKSHFKSKVRHIFERLIRKFSFEAIEGFVPESDKKLVINIRKRRERLKKQKAEQHKAARSGREDQGTDDRIEEDTLMTTTTTSAAAAAARKRIDMAKSKGFDHAVNGSESDMETDSDDDEAYVPEPLRNETRHVRSSGTLIHESNENDIVDFLDQSVISKVAAAPLRKGAKGGNRAKVDLQSHRAGQKQMHSFPTTSSGRLILNESEDGSGDEDTEMQSRQQDQESMQDHYKESLQSETAFVRTQDGRIKFLNKRKREDEESMETRSGAAAPSGDGAKNVGSRWTGGRNNRNPKTSGVDASAVNRMLGRQYKAKRAQGDVKKPGQADPHAYIPLSGHVVGNMHKSTRLDDSFKGILKAAQRGTHFGAKPKGNASETQNGKTFSRSKANKRHK
ncbi:hypothetical protein BASA61_009166 [Batrachochytrium salamandrivorans]|nr:hypothetical protein BASA61_009166 [Batrachochytrium salamandrivorans]